MILFAGDSWGCGEWNRYVEHHRYHHSVHGGVAEYFRNTNHEVINLSVGGQSTVGVSDILHHFLVNNAFLINDIDKIFVFQTDWARSIGQIPIEEFSQPKFDHYVNLKNYSLSKFYYNLSGTAQKFNKKIGIIGGLSDTIYIDQFESEYPGLFIACQSFVNLLISDDQRIINPVHGPFDIKHSDKIFNCNNINDKEAFIDDQNLVTQRVEIFKNYSEWFQPDGVHPNRTGHFKLFEYLKLKYF